MTINHQKEIKWINDCGCQVDYQLLSDAISWYSEKPVQAVKHIYLHGKYPAVSIGKEKVHVHRLLVMYKYKKKRLTKGVVVHHKDKNKFNSTMDNLEILTNQTHAHMHNSGKKLTEEHKQKIAFANKSRTGVKLKNIVNIPWVLLKNDLESGMSVNAIAKKYHCDLTTAKSKIRQLHENLGLLGEKL